MVERRRVLKRDGTRARAKTWSSRFLDPRGRKREVFLFESKTASLAFERRMLELVESAKGGESLGRDMLRWIGSLAPKYRKRFVLWGMIDERRIAAAAPIERLIAAWEESIRARGVSKAHLKATVERARRILDAVGVERWLDVDVLRVQAELTSRTQGEKGWGVARHNHHVGSLRQFGKWLAREKIVAENVLAGLNTLGKGSEAPRHPRRSLPPVEFEKLLRATLKSTVRVMGMQPKDRAELYWTAAFTGLRAREIADFAVHWARWSTMTENPETGKKRRVPAYLLPGAHETKGGKTSGRVDPIVLQSDLEAMLKRRCAGKAPRARVFPRFNRKRGAAMLRADLKAAGIPYIDEAGEYFDFHALRHLFITWAGDTRPSPQTHQGIARHSDYKLTAHYSHPQILDYAEVVEEMPHLGGLWNDPPKDPESETDFDAN